MDSEVNNIISKAGVAVGELSDSVCVFRKETALQLIKKSIVP
jgi:hypothetical protein